LKNKSYLSEKSKKLLISLTWMNLNRLKISCEKRLSREMKKGKRKNK